MEESELISAEDFAGNRNWKLGRNLYDDSQQETTSAENGKSAFEAQTSILSNLMFEENKEDTAAQSMIQLSILHDKDSPAIDENEVSGKLPPRSVGPGDSCPKVASKNVNSFHVQKLIKNLKKDAHHDEEAPEDDLLAMMDAL